MRLSIRAVVLALLLLDCAAWQPHPQSFQVMTFNIRLDLTSDGENAWPHRKQMVASMIRFHGADLIGLQEALPGQLRDLDALLPQFSRIGSGRDADLGGEHTAILYRKDRFEVLKHDTFWLSETPRLPGSKGWDAAYPRIVTWAKLRDRRTDTIFFHYNTHLDHVGVVARREGSRQLLQTIAETASGPFILTGDFNDLPGSEPFRMITGDGLPDAMIRSKSPHHGPTSTWNGFRAIEPGRRIDFIFVSGEVEVLQHGILSDTFDGRFPSDHLPVLAKIRLER